MPQTGLFALLSVHLQPNASRDQLVELREDGMVKIKIKAPAVEGKANRALIQYLHDILNVPVSRIQIIRGELSRDKVIRIDGMDADQLNKHLELILKG